jgi:hypothetical protein
MLALEESALAAVIRGETGPVANAKIVNPQIVSAGIKRNIKLS